MKLSPFRIALVVASLITGAIDLSRESKRDRLSVVDVGWHGEDCDAPGQINWLENERGLTCYPKEFPKRLERFFGPEVSHQP